MVFNRQKQKPADLQVPVAPTFPLSSPISEEIESPSCSSAEDRDPDRTRPFDFLSKVTKQKAEKREALARQISSLGLSHRDRDRQGEAPGPGSRHSIRGITKKKKNASKPVGLNLVTDFTLSAPPKKQKQNDREQERREENVPAPFVDLNDLKQLSMARGKERTEQTNPFLKEVPRSLPLQQQQKQLPNTNDSPQTHINPFLDPNTQDPFSDGFSPSDRNVMIGLTVPYADSSHRPKETDGTGDQYTPLTPSIIVTPAREDAPWSTPSPETLRPRAASSIYSRPISRVVGNEHNIPPVPAIPEAHKKGLASDFLSAHFNAMTRKRRSMSADTIFEDADISSPEDSHSQPRGQSHVSIDDNNQVPLASRLSINTQASRPESQGWWTYLLSPLLSKKSPLSPSFPRDALISPSTKSTREWWDEKEKETSHFSPDTPQTAVINWDEGNKNLEQSRSLDNDEATIVQKRKTVLSTIFPGGTIQGEAAEYYQACAHELFSKTPFFECVNHICSITPPGAIISPADSCPGETRDRALIFAEADGDNAADEKDRGIATSEGETKGLLIDVDSPKPDGHTKEVAVSSPASSSSADSWDSPLRKDKDDEKHIPEPTQDSSRGIAPEPQPQPSHPPPQQQPPVPVPEPFPPPPQEPMPPPAPAPVYQPPAPEPGPPPMPPQEIPPAQPPQIIHNYYGAPQEQPAMQQPAPNYGPVFPPQNEMPPPQQFHPEPQQFQPQPQHQPQSQVSDWPIAPPLTTDRSLGPEASRETVADPPAHSNEPISPGFQRAAAGPGAIQLSEVNHPGSHETNRDTSHDINAPAPAYTQYPREDHREVPLPPRYDLHPAPGAAVMDSSAPVGPMEARRRRLEREDAAGRKVGGFWRGRGCFSKKGCFGRPGREGRLRRRWYLVICTLFLVIIIVAIVLAITLTKKGDDTPVQSNWLNLTGYPPMPTGIATIAGTETQESTSTCIKPSSLWSCALPKDQQSDNKPYNGDEPTFRIQILFRNGSYPNSTTASTSSRKFRRGDIDWNPSPAIPALAEQSFLGNTTDGNSAPYAGEETPFYMTLLSPAHLSTANIYRRSNTSTTTSSNSSSGITASNLTDIFPAPEETTNGVPSAATLYPLPSSQPIRLYNRNKDTEHYGFYTYYDKSIFLSSRAPLDGGTTDKNPTDTNGGSKQSTSVTRCTWSQTRFLVQIWTKPDRINRALLSAGTNSSKTVSGSTATPTSSTSTSSSSATDYTRPGSFPYPVTITLDRHGGDEAKKLVYCYGVVDGGQAYNVTDKLLQVEDRGVGGTLVNSVLAGGSDTPGIDGGSGGCGCEWVNWIETG